MSSETSDHDAVLAANRDFYQAFARRDHEAMAALWSEDEPVTCIHPGWQGLFGRDAVMSSWRAIMNGDSPAIECSEPRVTVLGDVAIVVCIESAAGSPAQLAATNVFQRDDVGWKLVHHHAGLIARATSPEPPVKRTLN